MIEKHMICSGILVEFIVFDAVVSEFAHAFAIEAVR